MFVTYGRVLGYAYHRGSVGSAFVGLATLRSVIDFPIFGSLVVSVLGVTMQHKSVYPLLLQAAA